MAKQKKKIANGKLKKNNIDIIKNVSDLKREMLELIDNQKYVDAMDVMAKIAENQRMDSEIMERGAYCYFMTGDFERAGIWINNALTYDNNNLNAKLLLGRLCFAQARIDDGLKILSKLAQDCDGNIDAELEKGIKNLLEELCEKTSIIIDTEAFPALSRFVANPKEKSKTSDTDAKTALDRLKALIKKSKEKGNTAAQADAAVEEPVIPSESKEGSLEKQDKNDADIIKSIMEKPVGYAQKVKMLNAFAGSCYMKKDYAGALKLLQKAGELDPDNNTILCNICYSYIALNDIEKAMKVAASMPMIDFAVLKAIGD